MCDTNHIPRATAYLSPCEGLIRNDECADTVSELLVETLNSAKLLSAKSRRKKAGEIRLSSRSQSRMTGSGGNFGQIAAAESTCRKRGEQGD